MLVIITSQWASGGPQDANGALLWPIAGLRKSMGGLQGQIEAVWDAIETLGVYNGLLEAYRGAY